MIFQRSSKNKKVFPVVPFIILLLGIFIIFYSPIIFQEGNPWPQIKGMVQLTFCNKEVVKLDIGENKYITKKDSPEIIKSFMKDRGYELVEQMGSGYLFETESLSRAVVTHRYYSRFYSLWTITENIPKESLTSTLADELKECLPKSDMVSYEKCKEFLATIRNFNDCVKAGFSIMKSNPPQCAVPDGRNFIDEANSDWGVALVVLNNCEVESVFQNHSKLVTLQLKNGDKITVYEPQIDDVMKVAGNLRSKCGDMRLATE